jgi:hypothetical protein
MAKRKKKVNLKLDQGRPKQGDKDFAVIDPYTGEVEPPAEAAYQVTEVVPEDPGNRAGENFLLEEESLMDKTALDADADDVSWRINSYTEDENVEEVFEERQDLAASGRRKLKEKLNEHHSLSPNLSADDIDAAWEDSNVSGEESVGGTVPTPDQDIVEELGEAVGLTYKDNEPLNGDKLAERDRHRYELDPASAEDEDADREED